MGRVTSVSVLARYYSASVKGVLQRPAKQKSEVVQIILCGISGQILRFRPVRLRDLRAVAQPAPFIGEVMYGQTT
jgi:hypothetical protein